MKIRAFISNSYLRAVVLNLAFLFCLAWYIIYGGGWITLGIPLVALAWFFNALFEACRLILWASLRLAGRVVGWQFSRWGAVFSIVLFLATLAIFKPLGLASYAARDRLFLSKLDRYDAVVKSLDAVLPANGGEGTEEHPLIGTDRGLGVFVSGIRGSDGGLMVLFTTQEVGFPPDHIGYMYRSDDQPTARYPARTRIAPHWFALWDRDL